MLSFRFFACRHFAMPYAMPYHHRHIFFATFARCYFSLFLRHACFTAFLLLMLLRFLSSFAFRYCRAFAAASFFFYFLLFSSYHFRHFRCHAAAALRCRLRVMSFFACLRHYVIYADTPFSLLAFRYAIISVFRPDIFVAAVSYAA